uniref:F-box domain-containing protein n=1 Tax=Arundo donax TaxID=35708 RepID=A0A0A8ZPY4_ARUDO
MAPPVRPILPCLGATEPKRSPPVLSNDLLREIFLRTASPADLARASVACVSFLRLITDPSFLRRYRSLHPPLLLGFLGLDGIDPVRAPHPNAPAARALARAADFSMSYLPRDGALRDVRDGRILLELMDEEYEEGRFLWDLAVCDPLTRRCLLLPPIPDDLLASVGVQKHNVVNVDVFLVPSGYVEETPFKAIHCTIGQKSLVVFVFSSGSGCWSVGASTSWDALSLDEPQNSDVLGLCHYVYGCFFWKVIHRDKVLKLDMEEMEFSTYALPPDHIERTVVIVEAGEGKLAMFSRIPEGTSLDYYTFSQSGRDKAGEWHMKNTIPLPAHYECHIARQAEGHIFLLGIPKVRNGARPVCFSLEIKTFNIERVNGVRKPGFVFPYFGFPPFLSPRRIRGYKVFQFQD